MQPSNKPFIQRGGQTKSYLPPGLLQSHAGVSTHRSTSVAQQQDAELSHRCGTPESCSLPAPQGDSRAAWEMGSLSYTPKAAKQLKYSLTNEMFCLIKIKDAKSHSTSLYYPVPFSLLFFRNITLVSQLFVKWNEKVRSPQKPCFNINNITDVLKKPLNKYSDTG